MTAIPQTQRGVQRAATLGGLLVLGVLVWQIGISAVAHHLVQIGWLAPLLFVPSFCALLCDAKGWACTIPHAAQTRPVPLSSLSFAHLAGEAVTNLTPATYLGGEATRVYLLHTHGVTSTAGLASVVAARTALTLSQVVFILLGLSLFFHHFGWGHQGWWLLGLLLFMAYGFAAVLIRWQRRGFIGMVVRTVKRWFPRWQQPRRWEQGACQIDTHLVRLYDGHPQAFVASLAYYFLGWLLGAAETCLFFFLIEVPVSPLDAVIIEALVQPFTVAALIIPGALGVKEAGGVWLCQLLGLDDSAGLTVLMLKRARQSLYHLVGVAVLARTGHTLLSHRYAFLVKEQE